VNHVEFTCEIGTPTCDHTTWNSRVFFRKRFKICIFVLLVPKASPDLFHPSFLESVFESHAVMAQV
jgi:hypothetical protein